MRFWIVLAACLLLSPDAWAKKVYSPHIGAGEIELETQTDWLRAANPAVDGTIKQQFEISLGINRWWHSGIYAVYERRPAGGGFRHTATKWENMFAMPSLPHLPIHWGIYGEYIVATAGKADAVEFKLLAEGHDRRWSHRLNVVLKKALASNAGPPSLGYAWRSHYALSAWEWAIEAYGDLGTLRRLSPLARQRHLVGPVVSWKPMEDLEIEWGWLADVQAGGRYGIFKLNLELGF